MTSHLELRKDGSDGGPAYPVVEFEHHAGMSLRDAFAMAALPAIITLTADKAVSLKSIADEAWAQADAMLKARYQDD